MRSDIRGRTPLLIGASAAAVLAGVLIAVVVMNLGDETGLAQPSATPSDSATPSPTETQIPSPSPTATPPTSSPSPTPPSAAWDFSAIQTFEPGDGLQPFFSGVGWYDDIGFLAHGGWLDPSASDPERGPAIWWSTDGLSWGEATLPDADLVRFSTVDVAIGQVGTESRLVALLNGYSPSTSLVLVSEDGRQWRLAPAAPESGLVGSVTHGASGFVAVGGADVGVPGQTDGIVWRSADGLTWTQVATTGLERSLVMGVEWLGADEGGRYVAAGRPDVPGPATWSWVSEDGTTWERHAILPPIGAGSGSLSVGVVSDGDAVYVMGDDNGSYVAATGDGVTWIVDRALSDEAGFLSGLDVNAGTLVATTLVPPIDSPGSTSLWLRESSSAAWRQVEWPEGTPACCASGVAIGDGRTLILFNATVLMTPGQFP